MYRFNRGILLIVLSMSLWACPQGAGLPAVFDNAAKTNDTELSDPDENLTGDLEGSGDLDFGANPTGDIETEPGANEGARVNGEATTVAAADDRTSDSPIMWENIDPENVRAIGWPAHQSLPWSNADDFFEMIDGGTISDQVAKKAHAHYSYWLIREKGVIYSPISLIHIEESEIINRLTLEPGYYLIFITKDHQPYRYGNVQETFVNSQQLKDTVLDPHSRFLGERHVAKVLYQLPSGTLKHYIQKNLRQESIKTQLPAEAIEDFYVP